MGRKGKGKMQNRQGKGGVFGKARPAWRAGALLIIR
jgi:hypothetical protein